MKSATVRVPCDKCSGSGRINGFGHIQNGLCFRCNGSGGFDVSAAQHAADVAAAGEWASFARVEQALVAWLGGYGSAEASAAAILAFGGDCKSLVGFFLKGDEKLRAELATAYRAARASAAGKVEPKPPVSTARRTSRGRSAA